MKNASEAGTLLVYNLMAKSKGKAMADRWLRERSRGKLAPALKAKANENHISKHLALMLDAGRAQQATAPTGQAAIDKASVILRDSRQALGGSYPLVLALVTAALEDGHAPDNDFTCNTYHVMTTYHGLGWIAARAVGREHAYNPKTIQRWLHPHAPHADELRRWIGSKAWFTDTLRDYATGDPVLVIGGHVCRVYLRPGTCVTPTRKAMSTQWRNLEQDIHAGYTARGRTSNNVHIERTTQEDATAQKIRLETNKSTNRASQKTLLEEYHVYVDINTPAGARQLRADVQAATSALVKVLYGNTAKNEDVLRTLRAVWIAVKHDIVNNDDHGRRLLRQARDLALELHATEHTLKDPAAYVWALIERRGFAELRRDCPARLFKRSLWDQIAA